MLSTTTTTTPLQLEEEAIGEGFRPTDQELATHYLKLMLDGFYVLVSKIPVVDIYKYEPWDLPDLSGLTLPRSEWYFFCLHRCRMSRQTNGGFWKSTGKDRTIKDEAKRDTMFKKKCLVYHSGRSGTPGSSGTNWVTHEIRLTLADGTTQGDYVLCKVIKRPDKNAKASTCSEGEPSSEMANLPQEVMVDEQPNVSFIGYNDQCYGLNPTPESCVTPEADQLSVFDYGIWSKRLTI